MNRRRSLSHHSIVALLGVLLIAVVGVLGYVRYTQARQHLDSLQAHLQRVEQMAAGDPATLLRPETLQTLRDTVHGAYTDLQALESAAGPLLGLAPYLGWLPSIGGDVAAAPHLLRMGLEGTAAAEEGLAALPALMQALSPAQGDGTTTPRSSERLLAVLLEAQPLLDRLSPRLQTITYERQQIDRARLSSRTGGLLDRLDRYLAPLPLLLQVAGAAPRLLGSEGPRSYLILAQNNDELRATGGFISGVALLRLDRGRLESLDFMDSYAVDDLAKPHPSPPAPLLRYMNAGLLLLRDANWWPDFPTSARTIASIYETDRGMRPDGIIAVDMVTLQLLVEALGPLQMERTGDTVTSSNLTELLHRYWASPTNQGQTGDWWSHRKDFMGDLLQALMARLEKDVAPTDLTRLAKALRQALDERHILVYVQDPAVALLLADASWGGGLSPTTGDYLLVVDSNLGFNKVGPRIEESLDYAVTLGPDGRGQAQVSIAYRHTGQNPQIACIHEARYDATYEGMMERCYWDYLRVYAPAGSTLVGEAGGEVGVAAPEGDKEVFDSFFVLGPGRERIVNFRYFLPHVVAREDALHVYRLTVQKQAGTLQLPLRIRVTLPVGTQLVSASPSPASLQGQVVEYHLSLRTDQTVQLLFR